MPGSWFQHLLQRLSLTILFIIDRDTISVYFIFVTVILYYRPRFYLGLFCFCSSYTLLFIVDRDTISVYFVFVTVILYYLFIYLLFRQIVILCHTVFVDRDTISVYFVFVTVILYYLFIYLLFRQIVILCHTVSQKLTIISPSNFLCVLSNV